MAERAIELMRERMNSRTVFGKKLAEHGVPLQQIAECRIKVQHSGNIQGTFREHSGEFREHVRNIEGTFWEHCVNISTNFREPFGDIESNFWHKSGIVAHD